jgi:PAS domain S-box-containing protein
LRLADLHPPAVAEKFEADVQPIVLRDLVWRGESVLLTRSGREIAVEQIAVARRSFDGRAGSVATLMRDIGRSKRGKATLRASEKWFQLLVDTMTDGYAFVNRAGVVVDSNPQFARLSGWPQRAVIGRAFRDFVTIEKPGVELESDSRVAPADYHGKAMLRRVDGQIVPVIVLVRNVSAAEAGVAGSCVVVTDSSAVAPGASSPHENQYERLCYSCQILNAQEAERKRIATELHDGLGQSLSLIKFELEHALARVNSNANVEAAATIEGLIPKVKRALDEVRHIAMNLRPSTLDDLGILATLSWFLREYGSVYRSIVVDKAIEVRESDVPDALKLPIYRIVQEALNNAAKHSRATRVCVRIWKEAGMLRLLIEDDGVGFDPGEVAARRGPRKTCGHAGTRDRVQLSGGNLNIESMPGAGVRIGITWSCSDAQLEECSSRADV